MTKQTRRYTSAEHDFAQKLFANAKANGILKAPRALAALALSNGYRQTVTASAVTYRDYLPEARRTLEARPRPRTQLRKM